MNELKVLEKMSYGFYDSEAMTYNPVMFTAPGAAILWNHPGGGSTVGWLLGEADHFKQSGQYDIVIPQENGGVISVHWDHLQPIFVPTV